MYQAGVNEKLLGDFIRKHNVRDKIFRKSNGCAAIKRSHLIVSTLVASKCGFDIDAPVRTVTNSPAHIETYIERTIERLGFTPDLYYLHRIDPSKSSRLITNWLFLTCTFSI